VTDSTAWLRWLDSSQQSHAIPIPIPRAFEPSPGPAEPVERLPTYNQRRPPCSAGACPAPPCVRGRLRGNRPTDPGESSGPRGLRGPSSVPLWLRGFPIPRCLSGRIPGPGVSRGHTESPEACEEPEAGVDVARKIAPSVRGPERPAAGIFRASVPPRAQRCHRRRTLLPWARPEIAVLACWATARGLAWDLLQFRLEGCVERRKPCKRGAS
jgi:hypothetical protein